MGEGVMAHASAEQGAFSRLDRGTKLVGQEPSLGWGAGWVVKWYPDAGEAVIWFRPTDLKMSPGLPADCVEPDVDANRSRAERRARSKVRLYCAANRIDRLMSLTYGPPRCTDPDRARRDVQRFIRRLRCHLGHRFAYVWVLELHKDQTHLHVHIGIGEFVPKPAMEAAWGHGWVDVRRIRTTKGSGPRAKTNRTAHYLSKYVGKAMGEAAGCGRHRYEVGQGFQPRSTGERCDSEEDARAWLFERMGGEVPSFQWTSAEFEDWPGPPTRGFRWEG